MLLGPRFYHPVLDTFLRASPHTYREIQAPEGTLVCVRIVGDAGGEWFVRREDEGWKLFYDVDGEADSCVTLDQSIAWKLFTKRTDRATARARFPDIRIDGDVELGERVLEMVSIMA
jgi:ubiquinone biosynthesis protein UbiJ